MASTTKIMTAIAALENSNLTDIVPSLKKQVQYTAQQ
jgi:D-alanyl-D-alanine carboxypeptidase